MKKIMLMMVVCLNLLFASHVFGLPLTGVFNLEDGLAWVLDPEGDGGNIGDEAIGRDNPSIPSWSFEGLIRTENILGDFHNNGDGTAYREIQTFRTGGTYHIHGDHLWGQATGTTYEVSVSSHFTGENYYDWTGVEWEWRESIGLSLVWGEFNDDPFLFELTDNVHFDKYGYDSIVDQIAYSGTVTNAEMSISPIPEPATILLFGIGIAGLASCRNRRKKG